MVTFARCATPTMRAHTPCIKTAAASLFFASSFYFTRMRYPSKCSKDRKKAIERKRVKKIGEVYSALAILLGLDLKKLNKVAILETAIKFIQKHHEKMDIAVPLLDLHDEEISANISSLKVSFA